jgi:GTP pyrophosphokinase
VPERDSTAPSLTRRFAAAFALAWAIHGDQFRKKTGIPYMAHVMSVSALAMEHGADEDVAIAALLHDTVEDSENGAATLSVIEDQFGKQVAHIVLACSDAVAVPGQPKPDWRERKEQYLHHLDVDADASVLLVSACDKVHNSSAILADLRSEGDSVWQRFTV